MNRLARVTRALDAGARLEMRLAGLDPDSLRLALREAPGGAFIVDASFVLPSDKADALVALVDKHEPVGDGEPITH